MELNFHMLNAEATALLHLRFSKLNKNLNLYH